MNDIAYPACWSSQRTDHRSWPMWRRFAFDAITATAQEMNRGSGAHIAIVKRLSGTLDTRSVASLNSHPIIGTVIIAIASGPR